MEVIMTDMTFPVEYKVYIWDSFEEEKRTYYGVTIAKNCTEAMNNITKYYGDSSIIEVSLYTHETNSIYILQLLLQ